MRWWRKRWTISTVCLWQDGQRSLCNNMTVLGLQGLRCTHFMISKRVYRAERLLLLSILSDQPLWSRHSAEEMRTARLRTLHSVSNLIRIEGTRQDHDLQDVIFQKEGKRVREEEITEAREARSQLNQPLGPPEHRIHRTFGAQHSAVCSPEKTARPRHQRSKEHQERLMA